VGAPEMGQLYVGPVRPLRSTTEHHQASQKRSGAQSAASSGQRGRVRGELPMSGWEGDHRTRVGPPESGSQSLGRGVTGVILLELALVA